MTSFYVGANSEPQNFAELSTLPGNAEKLQKSVATSQNLKPTQKKVKFLRLT